MAKKMSDIQNISESLEDYIEAIYILSLENRPARVSDISKMLGVRRSSVSGALKNLSSMDIVNHTPYSPITLTAEGEKLGREMFKRHKALKNFFITVLGIDPKKADETACHMEHAVDREILGKLIALINFIETCPRLGTEWIRNHIKGCLTRPPDERCRICLETCLKDLDKQTEQSK